VTSFPVGVRGGACMLVSDEEYPQVLTDRLLGATKRCLASVFIVDTAGSSEWFPAIFSALEDAAWRGLDVRVLLGGSRINLAIAQRTAGSAEVLRERHIPMRWLTAQQRRGSHAKAVVVDDVVLVGSHNWSAGAFGGQHQDSVLVASADLASYLAGFFNEQWNRAEDG
jgi:phosphatidylserine/phosphatidylglycerophosphate/cardiolipin synthase-like enzyme